MLAVLCLACEPVVPEGRFACTTDEDCPDEMVCRGNVSRCYSTHVDAGRRQDGGTSDAGATDASSDAD